jgi:hypothetical protein
MRGTVCKLRRKGATVFREDLAEDLMRLANMAMRGGVLGGEKVRRLKNKKILQLAGKVSQRNYIKG